MSTIRLSTHSLKHAIQWTAPPFSFDRIPNIQFSQISLRNLQWTLYLSFPLSTSDSFVPPEHPFHFSFMCSHILALLVPLYLKSIFCTSVLIFLLYLPDPATRSPVLLPLKFYLWYLSVLSNLPLCLYCFFGILPFLLYPYFFFRTLHLLYF